MTYNATVYRSNADGRHVSTFIAEVDELGFMLRSNSVQCSGYEGTREYDAYLHRTHPGDSFTVYHDSGQGYRDVLRGLVLPPAYH